jgi:glycosyltransferase involved in cell wall biosynthesis
MLLLKICIWMNIPSHYQASFFCALQRRDDVDLVVRYFHVSSDLRKREGWATHHLETYEKSVEGLPAQEAMAETVPDWRQRIHVINSNFSRDLVELFCRESVSWVHWSEMPGIRLAELLRYRIWLYRLLNPLMLLLKFRESYRLKRYALGVFVQGVLAERSFRIMGVPQKKIAYLYYSPDSLVEMPPCPKVVDFARGRKVFLYVGGLCQRKGIDVLLRAFSHLNTTDSCLVLCGLDKESGCYALLAEELEVQNSVLFLGSYPAKQIAEVYSASDVFILPSRFDGWGTVLNEAASLGLPLIATDMCGASWHVIKEGENGFKVRTDSIADLKNALQVYVSNTTLINKHGERSKTVFFEEFSPEKNVDRLVNAIRTWSRK